MNEQNCEIDFHVIIGKCQENAWRDYEKGKSVNVDEMLAGRELDNLMAIEVMGWGCEASASWSPSTDIAAAWDVVEKMRLFVIPFGVDEWASTDKRSERLLFEQLEIADTAPLAICRAALKAVTE